MTDKQLAKLIILSVRKAVKEEMLTFKQQILQELKRPVSGKKDSLVEVQKTFRQNYQVQQPRKANFSKDPLLNELLRSTQPVPADDFMEELEINVPTDESGRPMRGLNNPKMNAVLEAMNKDYSSEIEPIRDNSLQKQQFRQSVMSKMFEETEPLQSTQDEEEDFSFLDGVS